MRLGILGGTFDPIHKGHFLLAQSAIDSLSLDEVMLLPAHRNPLKQGQITPAKHRLEMARLAIQDEARLSVSDIEVVRGGASYAVDTLQELTYAQPAEYWFLIGTDALKTISNWKQPKRLLQLCRLGVVLRSGQTREEVLASCPEYVSPFIDWIDMSRIDISSTSLRERLVRGQQVGDDIKPIVLQYIRDNKLYRN